MIRPMTPPPYPVDGPEHRALLALASQAAGVDFAAYRVPTLVRRILHRMRASSAPDLASYLALLRCHAAEVDHLVNALLIKTTSMFRDPGTFAALRESVLPALCARRAGEGATSLSAWVLGCSTGEEAYSLAMCLLEATEKTSPTMDIVVLACDADPGVLERASRGSLSREQAARVPEALAARWLVDDSDGYSISDELRSALVFDRYDALDPSRRTPRRSVFASFDVVSCRNLLIYLEKEAQASLAVRLADACEPGSILVLGTSESLPDALSRKFTPVPSAESVLVGR
jgi:chemotaxis methyl-accepting protein methylase